MEYTINERKVYSNACQKIKYKAQLDILLAKETELLGLVDLFLNGGNHRDETLIFRRDGIRNILKPKIAEAKRQLNNCEKRLTYNANKC